MIIVKIIGGLGNQMFQYAYAKALEVRGYHVKIDISAFDTYTKHGGYQLNNYLTDMDIATKKDVMQFKSKNKILALIKKRKILKEKSLLFDGRLLNPLKNAYIEGYFQNAQKEIFKSFILKNILSNYSTELYNKILNTNYSYSIHIRRGDYLDNDNKNIFGTCDLDYYNNAINIINSQHKHTFFIFSNDIEWCKENFITNNIIFIDNKEERPPNEDIYLMSLCKNNIIANSSFSWWASWLNLNKNKIVIAPKNWFLDQKLSKQAVNLVPKNYIRL